MVYLSVKATAQSPADSLRAVTTDVLLYTITSEEKENYRKLPEKSLRLLLTRESGADAWKLPGGFVAQGERLANAALRTLRGAAEIPSPYLEQLYTWSGEAGGPAGCGGEGSSVDCSYLALSEPSAVRFRRGAAAERAWFSVSCRLYKEHRSITENGFVLKQFYRLLLRFEQEELSAEVELIRSVSGKSLQVERAVGQTKGLTPAQALRIQYSIERMRSKIEYTDIAFHLLPDLFTLTELQQVFETILGTTLLKANFRRKIADMVIETDRFAKEAGHRPSRLYRFNPK